MASSHGYSALFLKRFLYWTLLACVLDTPQAKCPAETWQFAIRHGVQPEPVEMLRTPEAAMLRTAGPTWLRQGPVHLRYRDLSDRIELSLLAEAHTTLGGARVVVPCATWQVSTRPSTLPAARQLLFRTWLNRWYALRDSLQETTYADSLLAPFLDSLWRAAP